MVETAGKKLRLTEEDVCALLQRYSAAAILCVLREVAQYPKVDINWEALLKKTSSGIKSARELQLLWRHLAYRHPLIDNKQLPLDDDVDVDVVVDDDVDDDSDLEFDVHAYPPVTPDTAFEAASCVHLLASAPSSDFGGLDSDFPSKSPFDIPPPSSSHLLSHSEPLDPNTSRKKRKWTDAEDSKLVAAVHKWGEGNWSSILKEGHWSRTASQLSQRWANMRKKQGGVNVGAATSAGPQLSEAQLATRRAIDMALKDNLTAVGNGAAGTNNPAKPKPSSNGESPVTTVTVPAQRQLSQAANISLKAAAVSSVPKPRPAMKKPPPKPPSISDTIQRTAVAAGARIVNPSVADALRNYANVHFFRTGTAVSVGAGLASFANNGNGGQHSKDNPVKPSQPATAVSQPQKSRTMPAVTLERSIVCSSACANDRLHKNEDKTSIEANVPCSEAKQMVKVQENNASLPRTLPKAPPVKSQSTSPCVAIGLSKPTADVGNSQCAITKGNPANEGKDETSNQVVVDPVVMDVGENLSAIQGSCTPSVNGSHESFSSSIVDASTEKMEGSSEGLAEAK